MLCSLFVGDIRCHREQSPDHLDLQAPAQLHEAGAVPGRRLHQHTGQGHHRQALPDAGVPPLQSPVRQTHLREAGLAGQPAKQPPRQ